MVLGRRGIEALQRVRKIRRWLKRSVLNQTWVADAFSAPRVHQRMLTDKIRCNAFREAIQRTVKPGDTVVDLGAGTGLLSFFALQAGARHVYAIEMSRIHDAATELIKANGFQDRITLIHQNSKKVRLTERCDVLVSEILSAFCFDSEDVIEYMADARERFLKPGGRIIPQSAETFLLPISSEAFGLGSFPERFYDLDYSSFRKLLFSERSLVPASDEGFQELSAPALCYKLDFRHETRIPAKTFVPFRINREGRLDGFLGWFEACLCEDVKISNSPHLPLTHWWQLYFPTLGQPHVQSGQLIVLELEPKLVAGQIEWSYSVRTRALESPKESAKI